MRVPYMSLPASGRERNQERRGTPSGTRTDTREVQGCVGSVLGVETGFYQRSLTEDFRRRTGWDQLVSTHPSLLVSYKEWDLLPREYPGSCQVLVSVGSWVDDWGWTSVPGQETSPSVSAVGTRGREVDEDTRPW